MKADVIFLYYPETLAEQNTTIERELNWLHASEMYAGDITMMEDNRFHTVIEYDPEFFKANKLSFRGELGWLQDSGIFPDIIEY